MSNSIDVSLLNKDEFKVTVQSAATTTHQISVSDAEFEKYAAGAGRKEELIKQSFEFLLERESNTMILNKFKISVIESYFPEYPQDIKRRLQP